MLFRRRPQTVSEAPSFSHKAAKIWSQAEYEEFLDFIAENPQTGDLIEGTGGARKIRWTRPGMGKRGGTRVITYYYDENAPVYLLMLFAKNEQSDLNADDKKELAKVISAIKDRHKRRRLS
ncbi:MAG: type II toxin-antitoxin system RelE/ParE family toxin [Alphaproteobacteria bacterium]|nr:type II toxin-antitoxin system RelE/ParE family toxin [Alphaproteobacteria bacterium]